MNRTNVLASCILFSITLACPAHSQSVDWSTASLEEAKKETMKKLKIKDKKQVAYITTDLLKEYAGTAKAVEFKQETSSEEAKVSKIKKRGLAYFGMYGNSCVFLRGQVKFKAFAKGTPDYGCGTDNWVWNSQTGDTFTPQGNCSGNRPKTLLERPY